MAFRFRRKYALECTIAIGWGYDISHMQSICRLQLIT